MVWPSSRWEPRLRVGWALLLALPLVGGGADAAGVSNESSPHHVTIRVRWAEPVDGTTLADSINRLRIDADASVSLHVTHFNFLHYTIKYAVEERTIESYALLDRIWSQVLGLRVPPFERAAVGPATAFDGAILAWRRSLTSADAALAGLLQQYAGRTALTEDERSTVARQKEPIGTAAIASLGGQRQHAFDLATTSRELDEYEKVLVQHDLVTGRLKSFVTAASLVENGQAFTIGRKKAGTVVTFTMTPVDARQAQAGTPFSAAYFVRSRHALLLHVGYAAAGLGDVQFDKVRSASGSDLFLAVKSDDTTQDLVTFLSYELRNFGPSAELGVAATLGTGFQNPGEALYLGAGLRVTRFVLSAGAFSRSVATGEHKVAETVAGLADGRELYGSIARRRQWAPFAAVSIRVY